MRTHEIVSTIEQRATGYDALSAPARKQLLSDAKKEIDVFLTARECTPTANCAKFSRIGDKVVASALENGTNPHQVLNFARALGFPATAYQRELVTGLRPMLTPPPPALLAPPLQVSADSSQDSIRVSFQAADGSIQIMSKPLFAAHQATLLVNMTSGNYGDTVSRDGHFQLPTMPGRQLELFARWLVDDLAMDDLSTKDLKSAARAAAFLGCEEMAEEVGDDLRRRQVQVILSPVFQQFVQQSISGGELTVESVLSPLSQNLQVIMADNFRTNTADFSYQIGCSIWSRDTPDAAMQSKVAETAKKFGDAMTMALTLSGLAKHDVFYSSSPPEEHRAPYLHFRFALQFLPDEGIYDSMGFDRVIAVLNSLPS